MLPTIITPQRENCNCSTKGAWSDHIDADPDYQGIESRLGHDTEYRSDINTPIKMISNQLVSMRDTDILTPDNPETLFLEHPNFKTFQDAGYSPIEESWDSMFLGSWVYGAEKEVWDSAFLYKNLPSWDFTTVMYHAEPDVWGMFQDPSHQNWVAQQLGRPTGKLSFVKRNKSGIKEYAERLPTPLVVWFKGQKYRLTMTIWDLVKLGAPGKGFKGLLETFAIATDDKGKMDEWKKRMDEAYLNPEIHQTFVEYAVGDVRPLPQVIKGRLDMEAKISESICGKAIETKGVKPHLGNGAFNMKMIAQKIEVEAGIHAPWSKWSIGTPGKERPGKIDDVAKLGGFEYHQKHGRQSLRYKVATTAGGMARNMNPSRPVVTGALVDNDGKGMYAGIMNETPYCFGIPSYWGMSQDPKKASVTLGDWLRKNQRDFESRTLVLSGSTTEDLSFSQTLILSKIIGSSADVEAEVSYLNRVFESGSDADDKVILLTKQIINGIFTLDLLEVFKAGCSSREWKELLSKVRVEAFVGYRKRNKLNTWEEMNDQYSKSPSHVYEVENPNGGTKIVDDRPKGWIAIPLSEVSGRLNDLRNIAKCDRDRYTSMLSEGSLTGEEIEAAKLQVAIQESMQQNYKVMANSVFGATCSSILKMASLVAAHNITGAGRAWVWAHAISNSAALAVTDGGYCPLNEYRFVGSRNPSMNTLSLLVRSENLSSTYRNEIRIAPLGDLGNWKAEHVGYQGEGKDRTNITRLTNNLLDIEGYEENWDDLNQLNYEHMVNFWTRLGGKEGCPKVITDTRHAAKDVFVGAVSQSQVNYMLIPADPDTKPKVKARGHRVKMDAHSTVMGEKGSDLPFIVDAMHRIWRGERIPAYPPQYRPQMIKADQWSTMLDSSVDNVVKELSLLPGCTIHKRSWFRPLSLSAFQFQNLDQFTAWSNLHERTKSKKGYGLELLFTDEDGAVDYFKMVKEIQEKIDLGYMSFHSKSPNSPKTSKILNAKPDHPYNHQNPDDTMDIEDEPEDIYD